MRHKRLSTDTDQNPEESGYDNPALEDTDQEDVSRSNLQDQNDPPVFNKDTLFDDEPLTNVDVLDLRVERPAFTQELFDESFQTRARPSKPVRERFRCTFQCSGQCVKKTILGLLPFIDWLRHYNIKTDLVSDITAGLLVGIMTIPQGMAYGLLTSLPAVYGLYVSFFPVIIYFFLGTSRHISIGTFAVISIMINSVLEKTNCRDLAAQAINDNTTAISLGNLSTTIGENGTLVVSEESVDELPEVIMCKVKVATAVTFVTGVIQLFMGIFKLGFVTIYLSYPLTRGLTTGASIYVFTSQIKHVFGIKLNTYNGALKLVHTYIDIFKKLPTTNLAAFTTAAVSIVVMVLVKEFANPRVKKAIKMPIPIELTFIIIGTILSYFWKMKEQFGIDVVGLVPTGLPPPTIPEAKHILTYAVDGVSIALVSFALNASLVTLYAKKYNYKVNTNQELLAYGMSNTISSFFNCYVSAASLSRSSVHDGVGGKTQIVSLISAAMILVVLFAIGPLFAELPKSILAAIVIVNLKGMFLQFRDLKTLWIISKYDFMDWFVVFVAVMLLNVDLGLGVGLAFSLLSVIFRTQRPYTAVLGRVPGTDLYKNIDVYPSAKEIPGIKIFRFEASLYFANNEHFIQKLFQKTGVNPRKLFMEMTKYEKKVKNESKTAKNESLRKRNVNSEETKETKVDVMAPRAPISDIIIDCTTMAYIDFMGVRTLSEVIDEYKKVDINVYLAGCKVGVREMLEAAGFYENISKDQLFLCVHDAVLMIEEKRSRGSRQMIKSTSAISFKTRL